jgi:hypothetical protein
VKEAFEFLRLLETAMPPDKGAHHALVACRYGNEESSEEECAITLRRAGYIQNLFLDDNDLAQSPAVLVDRIVRFVRP